MSSFYQTNAMQGLYKVDEEWLRSLIFQIAQLQTEFGLLHAAMMKIRTI